MVYILNLKDPASLIIKHFFSFYLGLNPGPSDSEAEDIPMCHHASLIWVEFGQDSLELSHRIV